MICIMLRILLEIFGILKECNKRSRATSYEIYGQYSPSVLIFKMKTYKQVYYTKYEILQIINKIYNAIFATNSADKICVVCKE